MDAFDPFGGSRLTAEFLGVGGVAFVDDRTATAATTVT